MVGVPFFWMASIYIYKIDHLKMDPNVIYDMHNESQKDLVHALHSRLGLHEIDIENFQSRIQFFLMHGKGIGLLMMSQLG